MFTTAIALATALITGFALGAVCHSTKLRRLRTELTTTRRQAEHDPLTGLPNRAGMQHHHRKQVSTGHGHTMVLLDLDDFKTVNDTWGHQAGDAHLIAVAHRLTSACAAIGGIAGRLSGDEFLLLFPHTDLHVVEQATAILDHLGGLMTLTTDDLTFTAVPSASAGIALPIPGSAWADQLRRADIALYHAKTQPGRAILHTPGMCQPPSPAPHPATRLRDLKTALTDRAPGGQGATTARDGSSDGLPDPLSSHAAVAAN